MNKLSTLLFALLLMSGVCLNVLYNKYRHKCREIKALSIDPLILHEKVKNPPSWMQEQIEEDLKMYSSGITKEMIDQGCYGKKQEDFSLVRFTIQDGHISFAHDRKNYQTRHFKELLGAIELLNTHFDLPDVDFLVSLEDGFAASPKIGPCLVFAKTDEVQDLILMPDIKALCGYERLRKEIPKLSFQQKWERKKPLCFWRGSSTGGYSTLANWQKLPRAELVCFSLAHPDKIDAKFTHVVQCDQEIPELFKTQGMVAKSENKQKHLEYKYLIDVDGNSCSYERLFWLLLSNSVVFKQKSLNKQWYYKGLKPYQHFIPIQKDFSDLLEKIRWAEENDEKCFQIAEKASLFVEENLSQEDTLLYLYLLLKRYASLQKF